MGRGRQVESCTRKKRIEVDVLARPEQADEAHELARALVAGGVVRLEVAVLPMVVLAGDDVDEHAPAAELVERRRRAGEGRRLPVAGADRDQRLEAARDRRQGGAEREAVCPAPAGADQRAVEAVLLRRGGNAGAEAERPP